MSFWSQKIKKEISVSLYPLQPVAEEEEDKGLRRTYGPHCGLPKASTFVKGRRLPSGKALKGGVAQPGA